MLVFILARAVLLAALSMLEVTSRQGMLLPWILQTRDAVVCVCVCECVCVCVLSVVQGHPQAPYGPPLGTTNMLAVFDACVRVRVRVHACTRACTCVFAMCTCVFAMGVPPPASPTKGVCEAGWPQPSHHGPIPAPYPMNMKSTKTKQACWHCVGFMTHLVPSDRTAHTSGYRAARAARKSVMSW